MGGRDAALPRRRYGTYWPRAFYGSAPEPGRYRGVASVPDECRLPNPPDLDPRQLRRLRDGLRRLWTVDDAA